MRLRPGAPVKPVSGLPAESTGFIAAHRELLVIEHRFAKQLDLLHLVIGRCCRPREGLCLDAIDLRLHLPDFLPDGWWQRSVVAPTLRRRVWQR